MTTNVARRALVLIAAVVASGTPGAREAPRLAPGGRPGLVHSLSRPGTNVTGLSVLADALTTKNVKALFELVPRSRRIMLLADPGRSGMAPVPGAAQAVARDKGHELKWAPITVDVQSAHQALASCERRRPDGLLGPIQVGALAHAALIQAQVRRLRLSAVGLHRAGAVLQIGPDFAASARESADFVDRILRGTSPADLPVRQAHRFVVTVDAGLARELGLKLPQSILLRADKVVE